MPRVSTSTSKRPRAEEAEAEALARLTTVPLKIAGVLFGLTNGGAKGVAREQLLAPLEHIGCLNPNNATQKNRIENYPTADWFLHEGKGAEARIGLSREGVDAIHALFTNDEDEVDQDGLDALTRATTATTAAAPAAAPEAVATPISQRKPARQATATAGGGGGGAPAPAPAAVVEVEARFDDDEVLESVSIRGVRRYDGTGGSTLASYASCASCAAPRSSARLLPRRSSKCRPLPVALNTP